MNNPLTPDAVDRAHDLVVELNPYQASLDLAEYVNRSDRPLAQFQALVSFLLATVKLHPDDMNDAIAAAFIEFERRSAAEWWARLGPEMQRHWLKLSDGGGMEDAYRVFLESSRGQG